ncbi:2-phospho-L-lactate guanylyltransferase [Nocardioides baekrokdamisoli]|uniref:2-phospho-L-lactate guanylyltransferase n=1 Tax=Nocardioides baekrokdamisoli TaxID=1804624 RepID=A0A3G9IH94_9ACTN|nr:2-phospho-L-lactate guanylyltransferase [Nocardioides baekrokdamisoli]BBH18397.1 2-phospho-L-lactate guanylyltransferase [Nocardioides baekrokdamisoli]
MSSSPATDPRRVSVIVPVKRLGAAKSRTQLPSAAREELALELMARTVGAALAATSVARVIVVAGDAAVAEAARTLGATVLTEPGSGGLNGAIAAGRDHAVQSFPDDDVAVVVGDLADLDSADLDAVVAEFHRTGTPLLVPDHLGTGTTMLVHALAESPSLLFGVDSAARHQAAGYTSFVAAPSSARRDVDSPADVELFSSAVR